MRAHLSLLLVLVLPLLPCFSLFTMARLSSSPSSILGWKTRFQPHPKLEPLLVTMSGRLTESLESVEDLETGEKGRKVELEEEEGEGRASPLELRKGGWSGWERREETVEPVGERMEEVSENLSQLGERGMATGFSLPWEILWVECLYSLDGRIIADWEE